MDKKKVVETKGQSKEIRLEGTYSKIYMWENPGNCKVVSFDHIGWTFNRHFDSLVAEIKKYTQMYFKVNLKYQKQIDQLKEVFPMVYCVHVPIGYGTGFQYHAMFAKHKSTQFMSRVVKMSEQDKIIEVYGENE